MMKHILEKLIITMQGDREQCREWIKKAHLRGEQDRLMTIEYHLFDYLNILKEIVGEVN